MEKYRRIVAVSILALTIILSCTVLGTKLTDPAVYSHTIAVLDKNRTTVLGLSAASAAASAAVSALPSDVCSPLAEQLSEFTTWFLLILSVVFLEKYLLTIFGFAACYILIPAGCGAHKTVKQKITTLHNTMSRKSFADATENPNLKSIMDMTTSSCICYNNRIIPNGPVNMSGCRLAALINGGFKNEKQTGKKGNG